MRITDHYIPMIAVTYVDFSSHFVALLEPTGLVIPVHRIIMQNLECTLEVCYLSFTLNAFPLFQVMLSPTTCSRLFYSTTPPCSCPKYSMTCGGSWLTTWRRKSRTTLKYYLITSTWTVGLFDDVFIFKLILFLNNINAIKAGIL